MQYETITRPQPRPVETEFAERGGRPTSCRADDSSWNPTGGFQHNRGSHLHLDTERPAGLVQIGGSNGLRNPFAAWFRGPFSPHPSCASRLSTYTGSLLRGGGRSSSRPFAREQAGDTDSGSLAAVRKHGVAPVQARISCHSRVFACYAIQARTVATVVRVGDRPLRNCATKDGLPVAPRPRMGRLFLFTVLSRGLRRRRGGTTRSRWRSAVAHRVTPLRQH